MAKVYHIDRVVVYRGLYRNVYASVYVRYEVLKMYEMRKMAKAAKLALQLLNNTRSEPLSTDDEIGVRSWLDSKGNRFIQLFDLMNDDTTWTDVESLDSIDFWWNDNWDDKSHDQPTIGVWNDDSGAVLVSDQPCTIDDLIDKSI